MQTPDPPDDTPGALKQVVLTPHDIPWSLRVCCFKLHHFLEEFLSVPSRVVLGHEKPIQQTLQGHWVGPLRSSIPRDPITERQMMSKGCSSSPPQQGI